jgi:hypothetical protein
MTNATEIHVEVIGDAAADENSRLPSGSTKVRQSIGGSVITTISPEEITGLLTTMSSAVAAGLKQTQPESWTVEFGLAFKGTTGIPTIASGEGTANIKVTMSWKRR